MVSKHNTQYVLNDKYIGGVGCYKTQKTKTENKTETWNLIAYDLITYVTGMIKFRTTKYVTNHPSIYEYIIYDAN